MSRSTFAAALAAGALWGAAGTAAASPTREVRIETEPEGAKIYFNSKEEGEICTTPCSVRAPIGETPIIIEAAKYKPDMQVLSVPARGKVKFSFKLDLALGNIVIDGPKGATILVDDEDRGTAPSTISVEAAPHTVVILQGTKQIYADSVEVSAGADTKVSPPRQTAAAAPPSPPGEEPDLGDGTPAVEKPRVPPAAHRAGNYVAISAEMDVSFRSFSYDNGNDKLSPYSENGHVMLGPLVEVWLGTLLDVPALRGLAIYGRAGFNASSQTVTQSDAQGKPVALTAKSASELFEASVRQRWTVGTTGTVEVSGGYVRDRFTFSGTADDVKLVPSTDYTSVRLGARGSLLFGTVEAYLAAENRIVLSGGPLGDRFYQSDASGLHAALGLTKHFGSFLVRAEGAITRYAWTFKANSPMDTYIADGGTDRITRIVFAVGYAY